MSTVLRQERHVEYVGGGIESFVITSSIADADRGALPHPFVFVYRINDRNDPKDDTFARVGTIADLTVLPKGRDAGLAGTRFGVGIEYLNTSSMLSYPDLDTAQSAQKAVQDRMNNLVVAWTSYATTFIATPTPASVVLPLVGPTTKAGLVAAFRAAKQTRYAVEISAAVAATALSAAQTKYTNLNTDVTTLNSIMATLSFAAGAYGTSKADLSALKAAAQTYHDAALGGAGPAMLVAIATATAADAVDTLNATAIANGIVAANGYVATKVAALGTAAAALTAAATANTVAIQLVTDALAIESSALMALQAVCPDFDPTTICRVAG